MLNGAVLDNHFDGGRAVEAAAEHLGENFRPGLFEVFDADGILVVGDGGHSVHQYSIRPIFFKPSFPDCSQPIGRPMFAAKFFCLEACPPANFPPARHSLSDPGRPRPRPVPRRFILLEVVRSSGFSRSRAPFSA
jgi:hypothetical protein